GFRVTGIVRSPSDLQGGRTYAGPAVFASRTFQSRYPDAFTFGGVHVLDLAPGTNIGELRSKLRAIAGTDVELFVTTPRDEYRDSVQRAMGVLTNAMLAVFAVVAVGGLLTLGQAAVRQIGQSAALAPTLARLGMKRTHAVVAVALAPLAAVATGTVAGAVGAVALSARFPVGIAGRAEPDPGVALDWIALVGGALAL